MIKSEGTGVSGQDQKKRAQGSGDRGQGQKIRVLGSGDRVKKIREQAVNTLDGVMEW